MSLTVDYFYSLTPRQFFNAYEGCQRKDREVWERFRVQYYAAIAPHWDRKKHGELTLKKAWPLPWDKDEAYQFEVRDPEAEQAEIKQNIAQWADHDKKQAQKAEKTP